MNRSDMAELARGQGDTLAPPHTVEIQAAEFADDWQKRPKSAVLLGLRTLPSEEDTIARKQAAKRAYEAFPDDQGKQIEEFSAELQAWAVARSICDPNDTKKAHPSLPRAEETIRAALSGLAISRIFDEIEKNQIETSPIFAEATDDDVGVLAGMLATDEPLSLLPAARQGRVRRLIGFIHSELLEAAPEEPEFIADQ